LRKTAAKLTGTLRYIERCVRVGKHLLAVVVQIPYALTTDRDVADAALYSTLVNCSDRFFTDRSRPWRYALRKVSISTSSNAL
jgi:hypothetical protein